MRDGGIGTKTGNHSADFLIIGVTPVFSIRALKEFLKVGDFSSVGVDGGAMAAKVDDVVDYADSVLYGFYGCFDDEIGLWLCTCGGRLWFGMTLVAFSAFCCANMLAC